MKGGAASSAPPLAALAALLFAVWQSNDLPIAWRDAPLERRAWLALLLWLAPLVVYLVRRFQTGRPLEAGFLPVAVGLVLCALSSFASVNVAAHIGLVCALGAWLHPLWVPSSPTQRLLIFAYLASAVLWMPAAGWLFGAVLGLPPVVQIALRVIFTAVGVIALTLATRESSQKP